MPAKRVLNSMTKYFTRQNYPFSILILEDHIRNWSFLMKGQCNYMKTYYFKDIHTKVSILALIYESNNKRNYYKWIFEQ